MRKTASVIASAVCVFLCASAYARAQSVITLESLEAKVPEAPGIMAQRSDIDAAFDEIAEAQAKSGFDYTYVNSIGPAAIIVPREIDEHVFHYEQAAGVNIPILGSRIAQQIAIFDAQERAAVAKITYQQQIRQYIYDLRDAYTHYWQYDTQAQFAQTYATTEQGALSQAQSLRRAGFWTSYNLFDFYVTLQKVKSEASEFESSRRAELAKIGTAVGYEVQSFAPQPPRFFAGCTLSRDRAIASANDVDATLAILAAQATQLNQELAHVHGSSVDASVQASAGSQTDINYRVSGYDVKAGVDVALPEHAKADERDRRAELTAELQGISFQEQQRRVALVSEIDARMADIASAQSALAQATQERVARAGDVEKALVRYNTIRQPGAQAFDDVQQNRDNLYAAQRAEAEANAAVWAAADDLLLVAPQACP